MQIIRHLAIQIIHRHILSNVVHIATPNLALSQRMVFLVVLRSLTNRIKCFLFLLRKNGKSLFTFNTIRILCRFKFPFPQLFKRFSVSYAHYVLVVQERKLVMQFRIFKFLACLTFLQGFKIFSLSLFKYCFFFYFSLFFSSLNVSIRASSIVIFGFAFLISLQCSTVFFGRYIIEILPLECLISTLCKSFFSSSVIFSFF